MIEKKSKCLVILILRRFRGGPVEGFLGGGQSGDIFRGGPVKKITLYIVIIRLVVALSKSSQARKMKEAPFFKRVLGASTTSAVVYGGSSW